MCGKLESRFGTFTSQVPEPTLQLAQHVRRKQTYFYHLYSVMNKNIANGRNMGGYGKKSQMSHYLINSDDSVLQYNGYKHTK